MSSIKSKTEKCPACNGKGHGGSCSWCGGKGTVIDINSNPPDRTCPRCNGTGKEQKTCQYCGGTGTISC